MSLDLGRNEVQMSEQDMIVTETNEKGIITFASKDFCKISGYSRAELLGQPHNLIRHPFMPSAAFKDLWQTVQSGNTWNGIVVNLTKDGGYYWVKATVFVSKEPDGSSKFISVRVKPTQNDIDAVIALYPKLD